MTDPKQPVLVLLSGGQDSTTCLFWAKREWPEAPIHALTVNYGQRHASELEAARDIGILGGVASHRFVDLTEAFGRSDSAMLARNAGTDLAGSGGLRDDKAPGGLPNSFVPGRNLVFLAVAAAHAGALGARCIVTGVCETDYSGYPDCRAEFVAAMEQAINQALPTQLRPIRVEAPLMYLDKERTVELMRELAGDEMRAKRLTDSEFAGAHAWQALGRSVTCYHGRNPGCGNCPSCGLRVMGFAKAGVVDPQFITVEV